MTPEDLAKALGNPGKFQILLYIVISMNYVYSCWNNLAMAFIGAETSHHCRVQNETDVARLVPLVEKGGKKQWDGCHLYAGYNTSKKISCPNGWTYYQSAREWTVVAEWDLVCDNAYKKGLATTLYFCGVMVGSLVFGTLSDKFGRRPLFFVAMYSPFAVGLLLYFFQNYIAFVILRFVLGILIEGLQITTFMFVVEILAIQYRTFAGVLTSVFWSIGVMSLALISYLIQDWRYIQLFTTTAGLLQIGLLCFLPESFRWFLTKKRIDDAREVVQRIARFNKLPFPGDVFDKVAEKSTVNDEIAVFEPAKHYTIVDIFKFSVLRKRSVILAWVWFSISVAYYGLALNVSSLAGNKYLNFLISGVFELTITVITAFGLQRYGRRKPLCLYSIVGGITCIAAGVLPNNADYVRNIATSLAVCGRICIAGIFSIMFIYTSELYPTVIRNVGLGSGVFWARIGSILAPQILLLGEYTTNAVPFIFFGGTVLVAGVLSLLLPETLNKRLAETLEEVERFEEMPHESGVQKDTELSILPLNETL